jgi:hypothetical protein
MHSLACIQFQAKLYIETRNVFIKFEKILSYLAPPIAYPDFHTICIGAHLTRVELPITDLYPMTEHFSRSLSSVLHFE